MKYFKKNSTNADEVINESGKNYSYKSLSINNINDSSSSSSLASTHQEKSIFYMQSSSMATTTHSNLNDLIIDSFDTSITLQNNTLNNANISTFCNNKNNSNSKNNNKNKGIKSKLEAKTNNKFLI